MILKFSLKNELDIIASYGTSYKHKKFNNTCLPFCSVDIEPPIITTQCPKNIHVETNRSMPTASVQWNEPVAKDNSKVIPKKTIRMILPSLDKQLIQKLKIPHKFKIGKTTVEYTFTDEVGKRSSCSFDVVVAG